MRLVHLHIPDITSFSRVSALQQTLTTRLLAHKKTLHPTSPPPDPTIITFTPNPVYTTGRRDLPPSNTCPSSTSLSLPPSLEPIRSLLIAPGTASTSSSNSPAEKKAEYHPTLRGGQTTYHGPGQMVAYTVLDLRRLGLTPRCHIRLLENSVIDVLRGYGITGQVTEDPGVWVPAPEGETGPAKKITAVGVHLRRNISSYGIGFNVTEEPMWYFRQIVPCGLEGREATSLHGLGVKDVGVGEVAGGFVEAFVRRLNADFACGGSATGEKVDEVYTVGEEELRGSE
ncbi:lipoyl(octanoyl) transferase LIP2 [Aspergillus melleus]|uniref:lipoyl(octanoyl) transferase LIP2 n=1 Tax=Aspergillus melleus TaxID=138277 RepID=UPI001E8D0460|nr:uncharacterized protein LDX57_004188 [Aspergillus melleus]KAH8426450.1 hypothetical protein LDX57_004188 [Aspergillus melleus]